MIRKPTLATHASASQHDRSAAHTHASKSEDTAMTVHVSKSVQIILSLPDSKSGNEYLANTSVASMLSGHAKH